MATLLKPWITRYLDAGGRQVRKGTPGARKVKDRASKWYGQYTDAEGRRRRVPLATDKAASRQMLAAMEREAALGRAGVLDPFAEHRLAPIAGHVAAFEVHLRTKGVTDAYRAETLREVRHILDGCGAATLRDVRPEAVERVLAALAARGTGPATRNHYLGAIRAFTRWCLLGRRLGEDPLACLRPASRATRRKRRALTPDELVRLLKAARERPLAEAETIRRGPRKGQRAARLKPGQRALMERIGREHALIYKMMVMTGLRRGEMEAMETRHLTLDGPRPCVTLPGEATKNRQEASIPLRADLAGDLAAWLRDTGKAGTDRVFFVGEEIIRALKKDLAFAGIPYRDEHGRTVDVHALRHTTATYLGKAKVAPRVAQQFMRHSDVNLTLKTYTDPRLLDEAEALEAMPELPLGNEDREAGQGGGSGTAAG